MTDLTPAEANAWGVLRDLLRYSAERMARHICNDYLLPDTPDNRALVTEWKQKQEPNEPVYLHPYNGTIVVMDWELLHLFADLADRLSNGAPEFEQP